MWLKTSEGDFLNSRDVVLARFLTADVAEVIPVIGGAVSGRPYGVAPAELRKVVSDWINMGNDSFLNVDRLSHIAFGRTADGRFEQARIFAADVPDLDVVFPFIAAEAQNIRACVDFRRTRRQKTLRGIVELPDDVTDEQLRKVVDAF